MNNTDGHILPADSRTENDVSQNPGEEREYCYAAVRYTVDFLAEINEQIGENNVRNLISTLREIVENGCRADEWIIGADTHGLNVLVLYTDRRELDKRIENWKLCFYEIAEKRGIHYDISFSAGVYEVGGSLNKLSVNKYIMKASFAQAFGEIYSSPFVKYYNDTDYETLRRQRYLETQMFTAINENQFVVYLQPQYSLPNRKIIGAEALVRWKHPKLGFIMPDEFISLFEQDHFILQLDFYVLEETCRLISRWRDNDLPLFPVSVNFSKLHASMAGFTDHFLNITRRYNINPEKICVEWTENVFTEPDMPIGVIAAELQSNGFKIAADDFGSGYSSLNSLTDLPVDIIKLDKRFLDFKPWDRRRIFLLHHIIQIARHLKFAVIAEGVEFEWQAELLYRLGYEYVQGFLCSRPVPASEYEKMIKKREA